MNSEQRTIVKRLQDNLYTIRQLAGWTADDLGNLLDVTKQTIYNLERGKPKMTWIQYLAIRKIVELEIERQPENTILPKAIAVLLDDEELPKDELIKLQNELKIIAKGMSRSSDKSIGLQLALQTIGAATIGIAAGILEKSPAAGINAWLLSINALNSSKEKDDKED